MAKKTLKEPTAPQVTQTVTVLDRPDIPPWWHGKPHDEFDALINSELPEWASAAIAVQVPSTGEVLRKVDVSGLPKNGIATIRARGEKLGGRVVSFTEPGDVTHSERFVMVWARGYMSVSVHSDTSIFLTLETTDHRLYHAVKVLVEEEITPLNRSGMAFVLARRGNDISLLPIGKGSSEVERDNYSPAVLKDFDHIIEDMKTDDPCGRMVLYSGPAGTGKSYLIRGMMEAINDGMFIMIPPTMVGEIANPELVSTLIKTKERKDVLGPTVLVIEDADVCLLPRDGGNLGLISNLLNFSDGIVGSLLDIRVVCTTNALQDNIDKALLRPGRICKRVEIPDLDAEHAHRVYTRLTGKRHPRLVSQTLAAVYSKARDDGWKPPVPIKVQDPRINRYIPDGDYD